jgi:hypothetical protein
MARGSLLPGIAKVDAPQLQCFTSRRGLGMKALCVLLIAVSTILVATIDAADARRGGRFFRGPHNGGKLLPHTPRKSYTPDVLTVDQLVDCLKTSEMMDQASDAIEAKRAVLKTKNDNIDRTKVEIDLREPRVNTRSKSEVDRFNNDVRQLNAMIVSYRADQEAFNSDVRSHNAALAPFNARCEKKYYADDMEAAQKVVEASK